MTSTAMPAMSANLAIDLSSSTTLRTENIRPMPRTGSSRSGLKDSASELKVQPPISAGDATAATNIAANSGTIAISASEPESPS